MARASFTLKRYLPINTEESTATWKSFDGGYGVGASADGNALLEYAESFDILIRAVSEDWITATDYQTLFFYGDLGGAQAILWKIFGADQGANAGKFSVTMTVNSQTATATSSVAIPLLDNSAYWVKFHFDGLTKTGYFYYADDSDEEPTSWLQVGTSISMSALSSYTTMTNQDDVGLGIYSTSTSPSNVGNRFHGLIKRGIIKTSNTQTVTQYFYYTGSATTWTVPSGVTSLEVLLWGGGRSGGQTFGTVSVTPGEVLTIRVGGTNSGATGGWPNGGNGGTNSADSSYGNGGCGSSDIKSGATVIAVAGGRGGDVKFLLSDPQVDTGLSQWGARCGNTTSVQFNPTVANSPNGGNGWGGGPHGKGGSQSAGGAAGFSTYAFVTSAATAGSSFQGGNGVSTNASATGGGRAAGGGGGGGYYGGGGGGVTTGTGDSKTGYPGGGGSSYINSSRVTNHKFAVRPNSDSSMGVTGTNSWRAAGAQVMNSNLWFLVPLVLTDTVDGSSGSNVYGPPQPDYSLSTYNGLVAIRWLP